MKRPIFLKPREKFLVLEIAGKGAKGLSFAVDEDRNLILEKFDGAIDLAKFFSSPVRNITQRAWEGEYLFRNARRKTIAVADPGSATTIPIPLELERERERAKTEITIAELENLIAQAMGRVFNQCRSEAAKRLDVYELDAVLVGAKADDFKVDGHKVGDPSGFIGRKITLFLELTFARRDVFEALAPFWSSPDDFYFAESPQARLTAVARIRPLPLNLIVEDERGTSLFILEKAEGGHPVLYREKLDWTSNQVVSRIRQEFEVSNGTARDLYIAYCAGGLSKDAARVMKKLVDPAISAFFREIEKKKLRGFVFLDAPYPLPFDLPYRHGRVTIDRLPTDEILGQLDFALDAERLTAMGIAANGTGILSRHLFPFIEAYFDRSNSGINKKLRRRLHWLLN